MQETRAAQIEDRIVLGLNEEVLESGGFFFPYPLVRATKTGTSGSRVGEFCLEQ
jgi:hypothetical protein